MDSRLAALYAECPKLRSEYIRDVLKLEGERARLVAEINGGIHEEEAELLARVTSDVNPRCSLEVGLGYGFSALTICAAGKRPAAERRHVAIDPHQSSYWKRVGVRHLVEAGFGNMINLREDLSFRVLPELEREGLKIDLAFIDGWHTFDFAFVDFFFIDKLLVENGVVIFDDADWASIRPIIRYAVTNLFYEVVATLPEKKSRDPFDVGLGLEGSCIALRKKQLPQERDIFFHRPFYRDVAP